MVEVYRYLDPRPEAGLHSRVDVPIYLGGLYFVIDIIVLPAVRATVLVLEIDAVRGHRST
jgi:hypothetical protein